MIGIYIFIGIMIALCVAFKEGNEDADNIDSKTGEKLFDIED